MQRLWNENYKERNDNYSGQNLPQCHHVYHKSHMDWPYIAVTNGKSTQQQQQQQQQQQMDS